MTRPTLGAPPAAKLLIPKGSLAAVLRPGVSRGATGAEKGLVVEGGELIGLPATLLGSRGARVGGGARRAGTGAGAWIKELNEEILGFFSVNVTNLMHCFCWLYHWSSLKSS